MVAEERGLAGDARATPTVLCPGCAPCTNPPVDLHTVAALGIVPTVQGRWEAGGRAGTCVPRPCISQPSGAPVSPSALLRGVCTGMSTTGEKKVRENR